ncbi:MAG TPA: UDP-N-acetylmuramoyl-L-alanine--D-glutamate ligase [Gaiellales bacterium]|nr:UDP-N-acetylmuramoyl-L-alanine--D-glutamate ligase [Gaiellales bacterium]
MTERYMVVGMARSGIAACEAIRRVWPAAGVVATDVDPAADAGRLAGLGVELHLGGEVMPVEGLSAVVKSPGVPSEAAQVEAARAAGVPVWSEVELAARMLPNPIAGVTGTNGKTTTTELLGAMLRAGGIDCEVAGNVGRPLSALAGRTAPDAWIACELSSFQLEDIDTFRCRVAVVLNLTPDHLDRHGTLTEYTRCKLRILENQRAEDTAVLNGDDSLLRAAHLPGAGRRVWTGRHGPRPFEWDRARLRGDHNLENAIAAAAAARAVGVEAGDIDRAVRGFPPLPHRLEPAGRAGGVEWVNDSKATNPAAVLMALTAFDRGVHLILGGSLKGGDFRELAAAVATGPVAAVYLIGQAAEAIGEALRGVGVAAQDCGTLEGAVRAAARAAAPGDTVLLSPACASFDQFRDFEDRGSTFRRLAREVAGAA